MVLVISTTVSSRFSMVVVNGLGMIERLLRYKLPKYAETIRESMSRFMVFVFRDRIRT